MKMLVVSLLMTQVLGLGPVQAAPRDAGGGNPKIINKLQAMVREITSQRDLLKSENEKTLAELEKLKEQLKQEKSATLSVENKLGSELAAQKNSHDEIQIRLNNTTAKLREVIDKYNALNQSKNVLSAEHANLQNNQKMTAVELKMCESKNIKLYEASREIIDSYNNCKTRGLMATLLESEPVLQIHNVEVETIIQEYQDKLEKQKYKPNTSTNTLN
jgi:chromosome segregation ATPase